MANRPPQIFNDGLLRFGAIETIRENGKKLDEKFVEVGSVYFNYLSIRQSDYELQGATEQTIDLKVKSFFTNQVTKSHKVIIEGWEYDIYMTDPDAERKYLYWYLQKVGRRWQEDN